MEFSINDINKCLGFIDWNESKVEDLNFHSVSIDSRNINPKDLFVAIKGEKYDGHNFINEVIKKGIKAVVIDKKKLDIIPKGLPFWRVRDPLEAFQSLALFKRKKLNIPVIAITGSVGKTTTKEIAGEVLQGFGKIKISERNNNNEIGVALTIHSCDEKEDLLVVEMGMRGLGQIEKLSQFSEPDIAVITNIGSSHIGILGSRDNIAKAKCEITKHLNPNGIVIIPKDDLLLEMYLKKIWNGRVMRVKVLNISESKKDNLSKVNEICGYYDELNNCIKIDNCVFEISLKGLHNAYNFLCVYAIAKELGLKFNLFNKFNFNDISGRNKLIKTRRFLIMDETYNASPESVKACIKVLLELPGKHFLILGSMRELGEYSVRFHEEILDFINKVNVDGCILLCDLNLEKELQFSSVPQNKIKIVNSIKEILPLLNLWISEGDSILIKGSRYWKLENIIPLIN